MVERVFIHPVQPSVVKWIARVRAGCLATRERLFRRRLVTSAACPCCLAAEEDEEHVLLGCPSTGTGDWLMLFREAWGLAAQELKMSMELPPENWLESHRWMLVAALIPTSLPAGTTLTSTEKVRFGKRLHLKLAQQTAERLRRRQVMIATTAGDASSAVAGSRFSGTVEALPWVRGMPRHCTLSSERQLSPRSLRELELRRRREQSAGMHPSAAVSSSSSSSTAPPMVPLVTERQAPPKGKPRAQWLRARLVRLLNEDTDICPVASGSTAEELLASFERITGELFSDTPGAMLTSRVRSIAKVLGNVTREMTFTPVLQSATRGMYRVWNRSPRVRMDLECWRRQELQRSASATPVLRLRSEMAGVDAELSTWLRGHRHLVPTEVEGGETGMALLILWEVDHGRSFPAGVEANNVAATLASFSRRLRQRVLKDEELRAWLEVREMQFPLAPGLPPSHQLRWSVRVTRPSPDEPQEWYEEFVLRWRSYLESLVAARPQGSQLVEPPVKRRRTTSPRGSSPEPLAGDASHRTPTRDDMRVDHLPSAEMQQRKRSGEDVTTNLPNSKRRQGDLRGWLRPGHGRAVEGPPT